MANARRGARPSAARRRREPPIGGVTDLGEPRVDADRFGAGEAQLDAVVLSRIVRRGEHRARRPESTGREIQQVGRCQTEQDDVSPLFG